MNSKQSVIIVAGGKGERMNSDVPKQFIKLMGKPILLHTLEIFHSYNPDAELIIVLPENQIEYWQNLCQTHKNTVWHKIVKGGQVRFESVLNGLKAVSPGQELIAVHDGVRPLVSYETISRTFTAAQKYGAAIPVLEPFESVRQVLPEGNKAIDRNTIRYVQTPQVFQAKLILEAYNQPFNPLFTDDASVVEAYGHTITLVEGNRDNIKITSPLDLLLAELFLSNPK